MYLKLQLRYRINYYYSPYNELDITKKKMMKFNILKKISIKDKRELMNS